MSGFRLHLSDGRNFEDVVDSLEKQIGLLIKVVVEQDARIGALNNTIASMNHRFYDNGRVYANRAD